MLIGASKGKQVPSMDYCMGGTTATRSPGHNVIRSVGQQVIRSGEVSGRLYKRLV